jgi:16S rRNA G1207 methylase RsmC
MVELAEIEDGHRVLEPSAGTGNILRAINSIEADAETVAVEINNQLFHTLLSLGMADVWNGDFLQQNGNLGKFDRILMNPPFANADDIKHIKHAITFLKPGGRLVAICAGGSRQEAQLMPICDSWEKLPEGTFKESGTGVNTVLLTYNA